MTRHPPPLPPDAAAGAPLRSLFVADASAPADTKTRILDAAFRVLASKGYTALNVREIARDAGLNHALINYHFGTKDRLVIAVLDEANRQLLQRQRLMYAAPGGFAEKWAQARRFYENDLASGFVRVQAELYAASLSNAELREQFLPRIQAWKQVVRDAVGEALQGCRPGALPPAFTADAIASLLSEFWLGMEFARLIDPAGEKPRHDQALDAVQQVLQLLDASVAAGAARADGAGEVQAPPDAPAAAARAATPARSSSTKARAQGRR